MTKQELIEFEEDIKEEFLAGHIKAPVHLSRGNEDELIGIFKLIKKDDWVFSTHRNHLHALLKGIPKEWLRQEILDGRSMHINSKEYKFFTSSIVCGCVPIAVGVAMAIKRKGLRNYVWCFVGDMAGEAGAFQECTKYASRNELPISFVIEDNGLSTNTPTQEAWGEQPPEWVINFAGNILYTTYKGARQVFITKYQYERGFPHINAGSKVVFK